MRERPSEEVRYLLLIITTPEISLVSEVVTSLNDLVWTLPFAQTNFCKYVPMQLVPTDFGLRDKSLALARVWKCSCRNISGIKRNT